MPKYKAIEREVWEATPSRIEGATQEINKRYLEYNKGTIEDKEAICMYLRNSYPDITGNEIDDYNIQIDMSTTPPISGNLSVSNTFANNIGPNVVTVFSGDLSLSALRAWDPYKES